MSNKPKKNTAAPKVEANTTAPEEVTVPPAEAAIEPSVSAPNEPMQIAGGNEEVDPRPMAVIASDLASKVSGKKGTTLFAAKSKDQAVEILVNGKSYRPSGREGVYVWEVADEDVELFEAHTHVQHGRIVKAAGK